MDSYFSSFGQYGSQSGTRIFIPGVLKHVSTLSKAHANYPDQVPLAYYLKYTRLFRSVIPAMVMLLLCQLQVSGEARAADLAGWSPQLSTSGFNAANCKPLLSGDVNGDGLPDLICPYDYGSAKTGTFVQLSNGVAASSWATWSTPTAAGSFAVGQCKTVQAGDVNGDGKADLICPYNYGNKTKTFVQFSSGSTGSGWTAWSPETPSSAFGVGQCQYMQTGDVNGDGKHDLICTYNYSGRASRTFVQISSGATASGWTGWSPEVLSNAFAIGQCNSVQTGDVNRDGRSDLICAYDYGGAKTTTFVQFSSGVTASGWTAWSPAGASGSFAVGQCKSLPVGDVNGDGLPDLICPYNYGSENRTFVQFSNGANASGWTAWSSETPSSSLSIANCKIIQVSDVNGDGAGDLVCLYDGGSAGSRLRPFVQLSKGNTASGWTAWLPEAPGFAVDQCRILAGDVDGDGGADLICAYDYGGAKTRTFVQFSSAATAGSWAAWSPVAESGTFSIGQCTPLRLTDINSDGMADLVCDYAYGGGVSTTFIQYSSGMQASAWTEFDTTPKWGQLIYLKAHCTGVHCPGTNGRYLHSNSPEGAGTSWGHKRAEYAWRVGGAAALVNNGRFSLVAHCTGDFDCETHNMALTSLGQEGSYSSWSPFDDSPDTPWIIEYDPPLRSGSIVHLKGQAGNYLHSNSPEGGGASWGSKDDRYAWTIEYSEGIANGIKMAIDGVEYTRNELKSELARQGMTLIEPVNGVLKLAADQCGTAWPEPPSGEVSRTSASASASTNVGLLNCAYEVTDGVELKVKGVYGGCSGQTGINGADTAHKGSCEFTTISAAVEVDMGGGVSNTYEVKGPNASACGGATITSACTGASAELVGTSTYMKDSNGNGAGVGAGIGVGFNNKGSVDSNSVNVEFDVEAGIGFSVKLDWNYAQTGEAIYKLGTDTVMIVNDTVAVVGERVSDAASQAVSDPGAFIVGSPEMVYATAMEAGEATLHFAEDTGQRIEDIGTKIGGAVEFIGNRWVNTGEAIGSGIGSAAEEVGNALNPGNWF